MTIFVVKLCGFNRFLLRLNHIYKQAMVQPMFVQVLSPLLSWYRGTSSSFVGSYQPSNELMLRFYAYFKQATLGPCCDARPGFWDLVGRAKHDAWKRLGDMSRNDAMTKYVDELHA